MNVKCSLIPKRIKLIVNKGQDLMLYHPRKIIKRQPQLWRVVFLGVVEKMATAKVHSETGNPEWLCEITVTAKNPQDPISLLVTDSKGRHIGQVLIPLNQIPAIPSEFSPDRRPPLVFSNIYKSELEPTKKNSYPKGYLYYWMWADEYWKEDELTKIKYKKTFSQSMHDLSNSMLNLVRRQKSTTSLHENNYSSNDFRGHMSTDTSLRGSPLKISNIKKKFKLGSDSSSSINSQTIMRSETMSSSPFYQGLYSKNPFDSADTTDISIENNIKKEEPYNPGDPHGKQPTLSLHHKVSNSSGDSPASIKKKNGLFNKFKSKKSQSSTDLTILPSEKDQMKIFYPLPQSLGKQEGQRIFEKKNDTLKSTKDISSWFCGDSELPIKRDQIPYNGSRRILRPQSMLVRGENEGNAPTITNYNNYSGPHDDQVRRQMANTIDINSNTFCGKDLPMVNKSREEMNKRELIDLITLLEGHLKVCTDRCKITEKQVEKLNIEKRDIQEDLKIVKDELCLLKLRLLEAGETKYLEKSEPKTRSEVLSDLALWRMKTKI